MPGGLYNVRTWHNSQCLSCNCKIPARIYSIICKKCIIYNLFDVPHWRRWITCTIWLFSRFWTACQLCGQKLSLTSTNVANLPWCCCNELWIWHNNRVWNTSYGTIYSCNALPLYPACYTIFLIWHCDIQSLYFSQEWPEVSTLRQRSLISQWLSMWLRDGTERRSSS